MGRQGAVLQHNPQPAHGTDLGLGTPNHHSKAPGRRLRRLHLQGSIGGGGVMELHVCRQEGPGGPLGSNILCRPEAGIVSHQHRRETDNIVRREWYKWNNENEMGMGKRPSTNWRR